MTDREADCLDKCARGGFECRMPNFQFRRGVSVGDAAALIRRVLT